MSDDKIAEIRAQHKASDNNFIEYESTWDIHAHRAFLLAEVDRRGAEIERLRADNERMHNVLYQIASKRPFVHNPWALARSALEGKP